MWWGGHQLGPLHAFGCSGHLEEHGRPFEAAERGAAAGSQCNRRFCFGFWCREVLARSKSAMPIYGTWGRPPGWGGGGPATRSTLLEDLLLDAVGLDDRAKDRGKSARECSQTLIDSGSERSPPGVADGSVGQSGAARTTTVRVSEDIAERLRAVVEMGLQPHELGIGGPRARVCVTRLVEELVRNGLPALERRVDRLRAQQEADAKQFRLNVRRGRLVAVAPPADDSPVRQTKTRKSPARQSPRQSTLFAD
jgi:hypothetical protein